MLVVLVVLGTSIWVYFDAKIIGVRKTEEESFLNMGPLGWMLGSMLLWIVVFPLYLGRRPGLIRKFRTSSDQLLPPPASPPRAVGTQDVDQQLRMLAKLRDDGILSQEEFDQKKKAVLGI